MTANGSNSIDTHAGTEGHLSVADSTSLGAGAESEYESGGGGTGEALAQMLMFMASAASAADRDQQGTGAEYSDDDGDIHDEYDDSDGHAPGSSGSHRVSGDDYENCSALDSTFAARPYYRHRIAEAAMGEGGHQQQLEDAQEDNVSIGSDSNSSSGSINNRVQSPAATTAATNNNSSSSSSRVDIQHFAARPGFRSSALTRSGGSGASSGFIHMSNSSSSSINNNSSSNNGSNGRRDKPEGGTKAVNAVGGSAEQVRANGPNDYDKWIPAMIANDNNVRSWYKLWYDFMYKNYRKKLPSSPTKVNYESIDLYHLYRGVCKRGGYDMMNSDQWRRVIREMSNYDPHSTTVVRKTRVVGHYEKLLLDFEMANPQDVAPRSELPDKSRSRSRDDDSAESDTSGTVRHRSRRIAARRSVRHARNVARTNGYLPPDIDQEDSERPKKVAKRHNMADATRHGSGQSSHHFAKPEPRNIDSDNIEHPYGKRLQEWSVDELCEYLRPYVAWKAVLLLRKNGISGCDLHSMIKVFPHEILSEALSIDLLKWMKVYVQLARHV